MRRLLKSRSILASKRQRHFYLINMVPAGPKIVEVLKIRAAAVPPQSITSHEITSTTLQATTILEDLTILDLVVVFQLLAQT